MVTPMAYFELMDAFKQTGCAMCRLLKRDAERYLNSMMYEYTLDPEMHKVMRSARGLCSEHGWQLLEVSGAAVGISVLYRAVVDEVVKTLEEGAHAPFPKLAQRLEATASCAVCKLMGTSEDSYITIFNQYLENTSFVEEYRQSAGLCLPHMRACLSHKTIPAQGKILIDAQRDMWVQMRADLEEFQDKNKYDRQQEAMGAEADSWRRAVAQMAGERGVFGVEKRGNGADR